MMRGDSKHQFKIAQSCKAKAGVRRRRCDARYGRAV
ncbi:hypothetical protein LTSEURB_3166, partial [Salmonella enterica subsp. enterica serovar Urbana str. R8-2977]